MEHPLCNQVRLQLVELDGDAPALAAALAPRLAEHLAQCDACARAVRALPMARAALTGLPRHAAPRELDSAVVASFHAGARTERALDALRQLARLEPPSQLRHAVDQLAAAPEDAPLDEDEFAAQATSALGRTPAPRVLDRLVEEELLDPAKARVRRHVGGLRRLNAPEALAERITADLRRTPAGAPERLRALASRRLKLVFGAAALFAVLVSAAVIDALRSASTPQGATSQERELAQGGSAARDAGALPRNRPFRVEHASSLGALSPMTRSLLDTASSGMTRPEGS